MKQRLVCRGGICLWRWVLALGFVLGPAFAIQIQAQDAPAAPPVVDNDSSPYHVALLDYKAGRFQDALDALNQSNAPIPTDQEEKVTILKSRILTELGQYDAGERLLRPLLTATGPIEIQIALGDLLLRKRDFNGAATMYDLALNTKPGNPDLLLKMVYTRVGASDLTTAAKIASTLKPLDPDDPAYYFARAAIAQATDKSQEAEDDIQTARTMYGITTANHYLKTYLEVLSAPTKDASAATTAPASTNAAPESPKP